MKRKQYRRLLQKNEGELLVNVKPTSNKAPMKVIEERVVDRVNNDANKII